MRMIMKSLEFTRRLDALEKRVADMEKEIKKTKKQKPVKKEKKDV